MLLNFIGNHAHLYIRCNNEKLQGTEKHTLKPTIRRRSANSRKQPTCLEFMISGACVLMPFVKVQERIVALKKKYHLV